MAWRFHHPGPFAQHRSFSPASKAPPAPDWKTLEPQKGHYLAEDVIATRDAV